MSEAGSVKLCNKPYELKSIPIAEIDMVDRQRSEYPDIQELSASIVENGLIQPICVYYTNDTKYPYRLIAGGRRIVAHREANIERIDAKVFSEPLDDYDKEMLELEENIQREDLSYADEVKAVKRVSDLYHAKFGVPAGSSSVGGHRQADTAKMLGKSQATVSQDIALAKAIELMPELGEQKNKSQALKMLRSQRLEVLEAEIKRRAEARVARTPIEKARKTLLESYKVGDFFEGVAKVKSGSAHLVELDPPYGIDLKNVKRDDSRLGTEHYNEVNQDEYVDFMERTLKECYRILRPDAWIVVWFAFEPWFETIYQLIRSAGFNGLRVPGVWVKTRPGQTHWPEYYLASSVEPFFYARKGNSVVKNQGRSNVFEYTPIHPDKKIHPTERPIEMIEDVISTFAPLHGVVVVPFLGSGNTLLAASNLGMSGIGWDLTDQYKARYAGRVIAGKPGEYYSYGPDKRADS